MSSPSTLIILVDALPYTVVRELSLFEKWDCVVPLKPGFGFSINLDAELFAGLTPDEVGYFNEWTYDPIGSPFPEMGWTGRLLDRLSAVYPFDRVLHRLLGKIWGQSLGNIPFQQLCYFRPVQHQVWEPHFPGNTLFKEVPHVKTIAAHEVANPRAGLGGRDEAAVEIAMQDLSAGKSVFLYLVDLDYISHLYGMGTSAYQRMLNLTTDWVDRMVNVFLTSNREGDVFLVSDHGMTNVNHSISLRLEEVAGIASPATYMYFIDSVILRVWSDDPSLLNTIRTYLLTLESGVLLTDEERTDGGLYNRQWGNLIYILDEGNVFSPTSYGRGVPQAMHGYHPKNESQFAVLAHIGKNAIDLSSFVGQEHLRTRDVYGIMKQTLLGH